jgi:hypothetical protein
MDGVASIGCEIITNVGEAAVGVRACPGRSSEATPEPLQPAGDHKELFAQPRIVRCARRGWTQSRDTQSPSGHSSCYGGGFGRDAVGKGPVAQLLLCRKEETS